MIIYQNIFVSNNYHLFVENEYCKNYHNIKWYTVVEATVRQCFLINYMLMFRFKSQKNCSPRFCKFIQRRFGNKFQHGFFRHGPFFVDNFFSRLVIIISWICAKFGHTLQKTHRPVENVGQLARWVFYAEKSAQRSCNGPVRFDYVYPIFETSNNLG